MMRIGGPRPVAPIAEIAAAPIAPTQKPDTFTADGKSTFSVESTAAKASLTGATAGIDPSGDLSRCTPTQRRVLEAVNTKAAKRSAEQYDAMLVRLAGFGVSKADVDAALAYLSRSKIQIHFNPDKELVMAKMPLNQAGPVPANPPKMDYKVKVDRGQRVIDAYLADDRFRNQFETGITDGSPTAFPGGRRDGWERTFFDGMYHEGAFNPDERPKYAALNPTERPAGMASQYGACFIELKPGAAARVSITPRNTSWCTEDMLGTLDHAAHVFNNMEPSYIAAIARASRGEAEIDPKASWLYMEAQVHGPVEFSKDVARLVADEKYKGTPYEAKLTAFCAQNGIPLEWRS